MLFLINYVTNAGCRHAPEALAWWFPQLVPTWQVSVPPDGEPAQIMLLFTTPPYASEPLQMLKGMISTCASFNVAEVLPLTEDSI